MLKPQMKTSMPQLMLEKSFTKRWSIHFGFWTEIFPCSQEFAAYFLKGINCGMTIKSSFVQVVSTAIVPQRTIQFYLDLHILMGWFPPSTNVCTLYSKTYIALEHSSGKWFYDCKLTLNSAILLPYFTLPHTHMLTLL